MKKHWIRKHLSSTLFCDIDGKIKNRYYYDAYAACGRFAILTGTVFRNKVTCKKCLRIMNKNERYNNKKHDNKKSQKHD